MDNVVIPLAPPLRRLLQDRLLSWLEVLRLGGSAAGVLQEMQRLLDYMREAGADPAALAALIKAQGGG